VAVEGNGGQFAVETVVEARHAGDSCSLAYLHDGTLVMAFAQEGALKFARRTGNAQWQIEDADLGDGQRVGADVDLIALPDGSAIMAHRQPDASELRLTWRTPDGHYHSETAVAPGSGGGVSPRVLPDGHGGVWVLHGVPVPNPEADSDAGLLLTSGTAGHLRTDMVEADNSGGSVGATLVDGRLVVVSRVFQHSALFGEFYAIRQYSGLPEDSQYDSLELNPQGTQRHTYTRLTASTTGLGEPVLAYTDDRAPYLGDAGGVRVCMWRPSDRDHDGLPDDQEAAHGGDPDVPDTDGDGRLDGQEVLVDFSDPAVPDQPMVPPPEPDAAPVIDAAPVADAALPERDAAVPDAAPPVDAFVFPDQGRPEADARVADAAVVTDAAQPVRDAAPTVDAAPVRDAAVAADVGPIEDAALPVADAALPMDDAALPAVDAALPMDDAATPRADAARPAADAVAPDAEADAESVVDGGGSHGGHGGGGGGCAQSGGVPAAFWPALFLLPVFRRFRARRS
jgi:hypothetical protein